MTADLSKHVVYGRATIRFAVLGIQCTNFTLHLRRCEIQSVCINGRSAGFELSDPLNDPVSLSEVSSERSRVRVDQAGEKCDSLIPRGENTELCVPLPPDISADVLDLWNALAAGNPAAQAIAEATVEAAASSSSAIIPQPFCQVSDLPTLTLVIEYNTTDAAVGAVFHENPSYMQVEGRFGMARCWMPCVDTLLSCDRCPWDINITVESHLCVIASGVLIDRVVNRDGDPGALNSCATASLAPPDRGYSWHSANDEQGAMHDERTEMLHPKETYCFRVPTALNACDIGVVVGEFLALPDPSFPVRVTHFCRPGRSRELVFAVLEVFSLVREFCSEYFGMDLPCASYNQVFIGTANMVELTRTYGGGLAVFSEKILHDDKSIDEGFDARVAIASAAVSMYLGDLIRPRMSEDAWFVLGLASHVTCLALIPVLGRNWYRLHIHDEVRQMASESRATAPILADVTKDSSFCIEKASVSVRRRALLIAYIIERRIGSDTLKRAVRDVVAETYRAWHGLNPHEECLLGLRVGPFLKRIRAICGADVRQLVRNWAASCGTPRIRLAYKYNPRRHQIDVAIEQRELGDEQQNGDKEGLHFQGSLCVRVMEPEGTCDHPVDVIDPCFVAELPCHSRRTKQKTAAASEKEPGEDTGRILPISWARIDPDMEWCIDYTFIQPESAWAAMLQSERDVVAQVDACRGLADYGTKSATCALYEALSNKKFYWRVRAEAASALTMCDGGLKVLLTYFCRSYTDLDGSTDGDEFEKAVSDGKIKLLRSSNFDDISEYMLQRSVIKAIASVCERGPVLGSSVLSTASEFVISVLREHDNSGNFFRDDHYLADLLRCASKVAVSCIDDLPRASESIISQIKRYRLLDRLVPDRSGIVVAAIMEGLADIEVAKLQHLRKSTNEARGRNGRIVPCRATTDPDLMALITDLSRLSTPSVARLQSLLSFVKLYGGDLQCLSWVLARVDQTSEGDNTLELPLTSRLLPPGHFIEDSSVRCGILRQILTELRRDSSGAAFCPLARALRRHTKLAIEVCTRIMRIAVGEADAEMRTLALHIARSAWGVGVPVCLLRDSEYIDASDRTTQQKAARNISQAHKPTTTEHSFVRDPAKASVAKATSNRLMPASAPKSAPLRSSVPTASALASRKPSSVVESGVKKARVSRPQSGNVGQKLENGQVEPNLTGLPYSKPPTVSLQSKLPVVLMMEEDRQYLRRAWEEVRGKGHAKSALGERKTIEKHASSLPHRSMSSAAGEFHLDADAHEGFDAVENGRVDDHQVDKRRKKKKKKRKRDGESEGFFGEGDESGAHQKKKKKKKKRKESVSERDGDGASMANGGSVMSSRTKPSTDGGQKSGDGKLAILKIKIGSTGAQVSTSAI